MSGAVLLVFFFKRWNVFYELRIKGEDHYLGFREPDVLRREISSLSNEHVTFLARVISAVLYGAMAVGEANSFTPNFAKAKLSAAHLMMLIRKESAIDNLSEKGQSPVSYTQPPFIPATAATRPLDHLSADSFLSCLLPRPCRINITETWSSAVSALTTRRAPTCPSCRG